MRKLKIPTCLSSSRSFWQAIWNSFPSSCCRWNPFFLFKSPPSLVFLALSVAVIVFFSRETRSECSN